MPQSTVRLSRDAPIAEADAGPVFPCRANSIFYATSFSPPEIRSLAHRDLLEKLGFTPLNRAFGAELLAVVRCLPLLDRATM